MGLFRRKKAAVEHGYDLGKYTEHDLNGITLMLAAVYDRHMDGGGLLNDEDNIVAAAASKVWLARVGEAFKMAKADPGSLWVMGCVVGYSLAGVGLGYLTEQEKA